MHDETTIRQKLADAEATVQKITSELNRAEGQRDRLVLMLTDLEERKRLSLRASWRRW